MVRQESKEKPFGILTIKLPVFDSNRMTYKQFKDKKLGCYMYTTPGSEIKESTKGYSINSLGGIVFVTDAVIEEALRNGNFDINL